MLAKTTKTVLACTMLASCAPSLPPEIVPSAPRLDHPHDVDPRGAADAPRETLAESDREGRFSVSDESGVRSVLLIPTAVEALVSVGPLARSRVFIGALFASQRIGADRVAGIGLVIKAVGGGLGPALSAQPRVVLEVDGEEFMRSSVDGRGLYSVQRGPWGPVETLMFPVEPEIVEAMSRGTLVRLNVGDSVVFRLEDGQITDLADFLERIPEGTRFDVRTEIPIVPAWRAQ